MGSVKMTMPCHQPRDGIRMTVDYVLWLPFVTHLQVAKGCEQGGLMPLTEERSHFRLSLLIEHCPSPAAVPLKA